MAEAEDQGKGGFPQSVACIAVGKSDICQESDIGPTIRSYCPSKEPQLQAPLENPSNTTSILGLGNPHYPTDEVKPTCDLCGSSNPIWRAGHDQDGNQLYCVRTKLLTRDVGSKLNLSIQKRNTPSH